MENVKLLLRCKASACSEGCPLGWALLLQHPNKLSYVVPHFSWMFFSRSQKNKSPYEEMFPGFPKGRSWAQRAAWGVVGPGRCPRAMGTWHGGTQAVGTVGVVWGSQRSFPTIFSLTILWSYNSVKGLAQSHGGKLLKDLSSLYGAALHGSFSWHRGSRATGLPTNQPLQWSQAWARSWAFLLHMDNPPGLCERHSFISFLTVFPTNENFQRKCILGTKKEKVIS